MPLFGPNINKMKEKRDTEALINELQNKDLRVRVEVVKALSELEHTKGLIEALKNDSPEIRAEAISALEGISDSESGDALLDVLYSEEVDGVWRKAFEAVTRPLIASVARSPSKAEGSKSILGSIGIGLLKRGRDKFALKCFEKAAEISPEKETLGSIGAALIEHGLNEEALQYFERFIKIDPNDARGWGGKGNALFKLGRVEEAMSCCERALELDPGLKGARDTLGAIYYMKGDLEAMASLARETLKYAPEDIKAHIMLSEALSLSGKLSEAEQVAQEALTFLNEMESLNPEDLSQVHQQLGEIYVMRGHREKALSEFEQADRAGSQDESFSRMLESCLILDTLGILLKGDPLERRARLLALTEKQCARGYANYQEKIIGETRVDQVDNIQDEAWKDQGVMDAVMKFWDRAHVEAAIHASRKIFVDNYIQAIEKLTKEWSRKT
jgi:tetratricopeptide (TPR) repeat protein